MKQGDNWLDAVFFTGTDNIPVMRKLRFIEMPFFRFDSCPFDRKAIGVQSSIRHQPDVFGIAVIMVYSIIARFQKIRMYHVFLRPVVAVDIIAFYLMCGGCRADEKVL